MEGKWILTVYYSSKMHVSRLIVVLNKICSMVHNHPQKLHYPHSTHSTQTHTHTQTPSHNTVTNINHPSDNDNDKQADQNLAHNITSTMSILHIAIFIWSFTKIMHELNRWFYSFHTSNQDQKMTSRCITLSFITLKFH